MYTDFLFLLSLTSSLPFSPIHLASAKTGFGRLRPRGKKKEVKVWSEERTMACCIPRQKRKRERFLSGACKSVCEKYRAWDCYCSKGLCFFLHMARLIYDHVYPARKTEPRAVILAGFSSASCYPLAHMSYGKGKSGKKLAESRQ